MLKHKLRKSIYLEKIRYAVH